MARRFGVPVVKAVSKKAAGAAELKNLREFHERQAVLKDALVANGRAIAGKRVLLLDDLIRSGATLGAVAAAHRRRSGYHLCIRSDEDTARMKKVFLSGSRRISRLPAEVRARLDEMIRRELTILVGDANGADKAIQTYFAQQRYPNLLVFCTAGDCRNNVGNWPVRAIDAPHRARDFAFFTAKDAAMADEADVGLALWDGQSSGTIVNVARLVARSKPAVVYAAPANTFFTLKTPDDFADFLSSADADVRERVEGYIHDHVAEFAQPQMF